MATNTPISWNEIRERAVVFAKQWADESSERSEAKSFWDAFFTVFGIRRRRVAQFEVPSKTEAGDGGFIDLLWKGVLLVEHKSRGKNLDKAFDQARHYFPGLIDRDLPRYVLVSDFARFRLYDLEEETQEEFPLKELHKQVRLFGFIAGYQSRSFGEQDPVNVRAVERLGELHDLLAASGYAGHPLEVLLVRLLFCVFAEDTGAFERRLFQDFLEQRTGEDGSDLGAHLHHLFEVLNTPRESRHATLDEQLAEFPYVNGRLFEESLPIPDFNRAMREALLECCALDWSRVSPAVFGSLFQFVMSRERRQQGMHYTSETNILKALQPLFLDRLREEFARIRKDKRRLADFHTKLAKIRILDPACGCGNFLVVAYRELRKLEIEVLHALYGEGQQVLDDLKLAILLDVDQFYGIETEEFPVQVAQVALWLTDHQMNMLAHEEFGPYFVRLPLRKSPNIHHGNALAIRWEQLVAPGDLTYIVGNPPFVGAKFMNEDQKADRERVFGNVKNVGLLDYVTCWYSKAARYMKANPALRAAFVSTNSISQGEQPGVLWPHLFDLGVRIFFAHRTFQWTTEVRGKSKAAVHCVIVGFALEDEPKKRLFEYEAVKGEPHELPVTRINPYLVEGPDIVLTGRSKPICPVPEMGVGNQPIDNGEYLFTPEEKAKFLAREPQAAPYFRRWLGADEFLNGYERWCLWLGDCPPNILRTMPESMKRVRSVREFRESRKRPNTVELGKTPTRFEVEFMPDSRYLVIPKVSSERRFYLPIGFLSPDTFSSDLLNVVAEATPYHFGVLSSLMHMAWMRAVCGRLKSDYRYSVGIVYNNFPWPDRPERGNTQIVEAAARGVLDTRKRFPKSTLADLYDPEAMPADLRAAHRALDRAVDRCYGNFRWDSEAKRVAFLFDLYEQYTAPVLSTARKKPGRARKSKT